MKTYLHATSLMASTYYWAAIVASVKTPLLKLKSHFNICHPTINLPLQPSMPPQTFTKFIQLIIAEDKPSTWGKLNYPCNK